MSYSRVIQERNGSNTPLVTYTRGKDLSGSLEGAGGIGGLLARSHGYSGGSWSTHNFYHADGNGNITCMVDSGQSVVASYKYDPYGRTISSSGSLAAANVYRFSSKEFHPNSGFYYYLCRFYDPNTQRWLNRDPKGESADLSLYSFVNNRPAENYDAFGLLTWPRPSPRPPFVNRLTWLQRCLDNCYLDWEMEVRQYTKKCASYPLSPTTPLIWLGWLGGGYHASVQYNLCVWGCERQLL